MDSIYLRISICPLETCVLIHTGCEIWKETSCLKNPFCAPSSTLNSSEVPGELRAITVFFPEVLRNNSIRNGLGFAVGIGLEWVGWGEERPILWVREEMESGPQMLKEQVLYGKWLLTMLEWKGRRSSLEIGKTLKEVPLWTANNSGVLRLK